MLKKLLKYEFQATGRTFGLSYLVLLGVALLGAVLFQVGALGHYQDYLAIPTAILLCAYACVLATVCVITVVIIVRRFYQNLLSKEGYLMNTLPVAPWQHIASKLIAGIVWFAASALVVLLSALLFGVICFSGTFSWSEFWNAVTSSFQQIIDRNGLTLTIGYVAKGLGSTLVLSVVSIAEFLLYMFASQMIGHQAKVHKALASVGAFFGLSIFSSIIQSVIAGVVALINPNITDLFAPGSGLSSILFSLASCVVLFAITNYLLKHRLNLE